jgi:hypothetical protein
LALQAVLDTATPDGAALALRAGEIARERYATSRDYFDLIMAADGLLIARLLDGSLRKSGADAAERAIITAYRNVCEQLPERCMRQLNSVETQIRLLAHFFEAKEQTKREPTATEQPVAIALTLRRIADELEGTPRGPQHKGGESDPPPEGPDEGPPGPNGPPSGNCSMSPAGESSESPIAAAEAEAPATGADPGSAPPPDSATSRKRGQKPSGRKS